ncbi:uncharacterized protein EKO05_0002896 [Ascochyta rabiei]|uniref:Uncharacterized protein n=1 Tax=Didymella rabiei TaxID=5454 RepID=A0A162X230_DIDRA|nr:uncharacterized protein EKO05_0002896 [Ascochyta rabiei]KZM19315.1 hypothetical protein ST47_g9556 [Ascochyta rabiei]UPX12342.1 hypothetical protein EKO05_0002896 [Ascochyta rabiei]
MAEQDGNVAMLQELSGYQLQQDECRKLLKVFNGNLEQAAEKFFSSDLSTVRKLIDGSTATWDESAFGASRYAEEAHSSVPTFNIDYPLGFDNHSRSGANSTAPTRPNSRIGTRPGSALSTHVGDDPMQSIENAQESGVTGSSKAVFGPATRSSYDTANWAMVPAATASAYIDDPAPSQRQREEGQPAILKPSPRYNYFPAMLAIIHSIPQFRNALLSPAVTQNDYWVGDEWWKGNPSGSGRTRIFDDSVGWDEAYELDIIYETQRLMAFLDNTDRAYATIESMLESDAWKQLEAPSLDDPDDDMLKFLMLWSAAYAKHDPKFEINGMLRSVVNAQQQVNSFVLDSTVTKRHERTPDIYDVLDDTFFPNPDGTAHIMDISNVLIFRLSSSDQDGNELGCRIPATLYPDRYLEKNKSVITAMFEEMASYDTQLSTINDQTDRLKFHTPAKRNSKTIESLKLIKTSMKAFQPNSEGDEPNAKDAATLSQLQELYESVESKLATLEEQRKQAQQTLNTISNRFKPTIDDGAEPLIDLTEPNYPKGQSAQDAMHHPYQLYGVSTRRDVIYLLHPDTASNTPDAKQWWRIQYDSESGSANIIRDRVDLQQVLERATSEAASVLLIYANEAAISEPPLPLSKPLEDFVKKDKLYFLEELQKNHDLGAAGVWADYGDEVRGDWDKETGPPEYNHDWANMSAKQYHEKDGQRESAMSSATLTPNTELDGESGVREMVEVNGGMDAMTGLRSDAMDVDTQTQSWDTQMVDVKEVQADEVKSQHIEFADRKGS